MFLKLKLSKFVSSVMIAMTVCTGFMQTSLAADEPKFQEIDYTKQQQKIGSHANRILVMPSALAKSTDVKDAFKEILGADNENGKIVRVVGKGPMTTYVVELDPKKAQEVKSKLAKDKKHFSAVQQSASFRMQGGFKTMAFNGPSYGSYKPLFNDPLWYFQKHLNTIRFNQLIALSGKFHTGGGIRLGIGDTGIDSANPDLTTNIVKRVDCVHEDENGLPLEKPTDPDLFGHGTAMAATAGAKTDNATLTSAPGYDVPMISLRVFDEFGFCWDEYLINCLLYAATHNIKLINWSLNAPPPYTLSNAYTYYPVLHAWMNWYATAPDSCRGLIINSAGNTPLADNADRNREPYLIAVAATNYDDTPTFFTTFGSRIDMAAPGRLILTSLKGGSYAVVSGTSPSAAMTSGVVAEIWAKNPGLSNFQMRTHLLNSLRKPAVYPTNLGGGVLDAQKLFSLVQ